jgi:dCMP deaminase
MRIDKINYYLNIAETVLQRATCIRRKYGSVIVSPEDYIISTGYNGSSRNQINCSDIGVCKREKLNIPSGERYELCVAVHSEQNAIISAKTSLKGSTLYLVGVNAKTNELLKDTAPCLLCSRMIINAGIEKVIIRRTPTEYEVQYVKDWEL